MAWPTQITAGGKRLECAGFGPEPDQAPTIVLLHEGLGCLALWRAFPQALTEATGWGVFAYSRAGYGFSDKADLPRPMTYMSQEAGDVVPQVLNAIGFQGGVLMGHSDGATIAAEYVGGTTDGRVRALILMAPHFYVEPEALAEIARAEALFYASDMRHRMAKYHKNPVETFTGWSQAWLDPRFAHFDVAEGIDHWRVPCLAIQGVDDQYGTLAQIEEIELRAYAPVQRLVLENCRHAPHEDRPDAVLKAVQHFLGWLERFEAAA